MRIKTLLLTIPLSLLPFTANAWNYEANIHLTGGNPPKPLYFNNCYTKISGSCYLNNNDFVGFAYNGATKKVLTCSYARKSQFSVCLSFPQQVNITITALPKQIVSQKNQYGVMVSSNIGKCAKNVPPSTPGSTTRCTVQYPKLTP